MEVTVTDSGPCRKTMTIKVPPEGVRQHVDEMFRSAAQKVQLKGFRKGHVPRTVLEQRFGAEIRSEAKESLITRSFQDALREHRLAVLGRPDLEGVTDATLDESAPLEFQVHFDVRPQIELERVRDIEVPRGDPAVTDADVDAALQRLAEEKRSLNSVDGPVEDGDFVKVDLSHRSETGDVVLERQNAQLNTNIPIAGTDAQTFADTLRGAAKGETREIAITFPDSFEKEEVRGQPGTVAMTVREVLRVVPAPIDDELAKAYDFDGLAALQEDLRRRLGEEKERANRRRQEEAILERLAAENPFDLPESTIEHETRHALSQFRQRLQEAKLDEAEVEKRIRDAEPEARADAERRLRFFFLLEAVGRKEKIFVTESDVEVELRRVAAQNEVPVEAVREHYEQQELLPELRMALMERKVRDHLREHARLTD